MSHVQAPSVWTDRGMLWKETALQGFLSASIQSKEKSSLFGIQRGKNPGAGEREETLKSLR